MTNGSRCNAGIAAFEHMAVKCSFLFKVCLGAHPVLTLHLAELVLIGSFSMFLWSGCMQLIATVQEFGHCVETG